MKNSAIFFENRDCKNYPYHNLKEINCLFCFCPIYYDNIAYENCPGNYKWIDGIKDCSKCTFPHKRKNYSKMLKIIGE